MAPESSRKSLPFEPGKRKGDDNSPGSKVSGSKAKAASKGSGAKAKQRNQAKTRQATLSSQAKDAAIPEAVSRRMLKRMILFSGVPTFAGVLTFFCQLFFAD